MTNQEAFDRMLLHLKEMKHRSVVVEMRVGYKVDRCAYRGNGGDKCVIGCLIPDELYERGIERKGIDSLLFDKSDRFPQIKELFRGVSSSLLSDMQGVHDNPDNWDEDGLLWSHSRPRILELAMYFGLKIPEEIQVCLSMT